MVSHLIDLYPEAKLEIYDDGKTYAFDLISDIDEMWKGMLLSLWDTNPWKPVARSKAA